MLRGNFTGPAPPASIQVSIVRLPTDDACLTDGGRLQDGGH